MSESPVNCPMCGTANLEPRCSNCGELLEMKPECALCRAKILDFCVLPVLQADCPSCHGSGWVESSQDGLTTETGCSCRSTLVVCDPCESELARLLAQPARRSEGKSWKDVGCFALLLLLAVALLPALYAEATDGALLLCPIAVLVVCYMMFRRSPEPEESVESAPTQLQDWVQGSRAFRALTRILKERRLQLYGDHPEEQEHADRLNQAAQQVASEPTADLESMRDDTRR